MALTGSCLCGAITYRADSEPLMTMLCHCEHCRRQSGAPASLGVVVERDAFEARGETLGSYETVGTDSGQPRERCFCTRCGSPIVTYVAEMPQLAVIKGGTLDDVAGLEPDGEMWCESALAWWPGFEDRGRFARGVPTG